MFFLSQVILNKFNLCDLKNLSSYSIAIGIALYASLYLYFLFYNTELLAVFNKFMIYVISVDLLLSTFYFYQINLNKKINFTEKEESQSEDLESELSESECESECVSEEESLEELSNDELELESDTNLLLEQIQNLISNDNDNETARIEELDEKEEENPLQQEQQEQQEQQKNFKEQLDMSLEVDQNKTNTNDQHNIILLEENVQIKPRKRRKNALQV